MRKQPISKTYRSSALVPARHIHMHGESPQLTHNTGLYTDESPGLKVDPFVVLVLSVGFIISVVGLHSKCSAHFQILRRC